MIYLDNAATTPVHPDVLEAMMPYLKEDFGNAGAIYGLGRRAADAVAKARRQVANLIGCEPNQIIFTSGGSEANNLVFAGLRPYLLENGKTHIIASAVEHDSVIKAVESICNPLCYNTENVIKPDFDATFLGVNHDGAISVCDLSDALTEQTGLVSIMYVNNETGAVNPVREIGKLCRSKNVLFHTDCVQAVGFQNVNVREIGCDFLSISSHKINAPKGVGALYVRDLSLLSPMIHGGVAQEFGYRGGTENVAGIVGFGKACEILSRELKANRKKANELRIAFEEALAERLNSLGLRHILHINSVCEPSKILNIRFDDIDGQTLLLLLDSIDICVSAGSACRSHEAEPSHVLMAMGLSADEARDSVRVSFSHMQERETVMYAAMMMVQCVAMLRAEQQAFRNAEDGEI